MKLKSRTYEIRASFTTDCELALTDSALILFGPTPEDVKLYIPGGEGDRLKIVDTHIKVKTVKEGEGNDANVVEIDDYQRFRRLDKPIYVQDCRPAQKIEIGSGGILGPGKSPR